MSSADRVAHDGATHAIIMELIHTRFQRSINAFKVTKPSNPFTNVCWVSVLTTIFCAAVVLGRIDSFLRPISRNEEMMGDGFLWCYCCRFVLNSKTSVEHILYEAGPAQ